MFVAPGAGLPECLSESGAGFGAGSGTPGDSLRRPTPRGKNEESRSTAAFLGGAMRDRTADLMRAKHALSQLSYGPEPA